MNCLKSFSIKLLAVSLYLLRGCSRNYVRIK